MGSNRQGNLAISVIMVVIIKFLVVGIGVCLGQESISETGGKQVTQEVKPSQEILDSYGDYLFDKNYILYFPSGKTLSFEKGIDGINISQEGKFSPNGRYLAYTYGNVGTFGIRIVELIIYDIEKGESRKFGQLNQLIKDIKWFTYRGKMYLLYNTFPKVPGYDNGFFYIVNPENGEKVLERQLWSFIEFLPAEDGIRYDVVRLGYETVSQGVAKFDNLLLFDVLFIPSPKAQEIIENRTNEVILAIKNKDMEKLFIFIHPDKGIRFSPYSYVDIENDLVFSGEQMRNILGDKGKNIWGAYDGSGEPIQLTFEEYFSRFIYDQDFANAKEIGYNRIIGSGNTVNNGFESYPGSIIVEYYFPGFDPKYGGMDWRSLRLVFEEKDNVWYLVGIIHDEWTI